MDPTLEEALDLIALWAPRDTRAFLRISAVSREDEWTVVEAVRSRVVHGVGVPCRVIPVPGVPEGVHLDQWVDALVEELRQDKTLALVVGFPTGQALGVEDLAVVLNWRRNSLHAAAGVQVWIMSALFSMTLRQSAPDLDSFFRLRLDLPPLGPVVTPPPRPTPASPALSTSLVRTRAQSSLERLQKAATVGVKVSAQEATSLLKPALQGLVEAGLEEEAALLEEQTGEILLADVRPLVEATPTRLDAPPDVPTAQAAFDARWAKDGPHHPETLAAETALADALETAGDLREARDHREAVWRARWVRLGADHHDTLAAREALATTLTALGDLPAARAYLEPLWERQRARLGPEHPTTLRIRLQLAEVHRALGDHVTAAALAEEVWRARDRILGEEHRLTLQARALLARIALDRGDPATARAHQEAVLEMRHRALGPRHPETTQAAWALYTTVDGLGDPAAPDVLRDHLAWLAAAPPETLPPEQARILAALNAPRSAGG